MRTKLFFIITIPFFFLSQSPIWNTVLFSKKQSIVQNGNFSTSTGWSLSGGANAVISGDVLYIKRNGGTGIADNTLLKSLVAGRKYYYSIRCIIVIGSQQLSLRDGSANTLVNIIGIESTTTRGTFTAVANSATIRLVYAATGGEGYWDNLVITPL